MGKDYVQKTKRRKLLGQETADENAVVYQESPSLELIKMCGCGT